MCGVCLYRYLAEADLVIYMEGGRVHSCGPPAQILPLMEARDVTSIVSKSKKPSRKSVASCSEDNNSDDVRKHNIFLCT